MKRRTFLMGTGAAVTAAAMGNRVVLAQPMPDELVWADDLPGNLDLGFQQAGDARRKDVMVVGGR